MKEVIMRVASFSADYPKAPIYVADLVRCKECKYWHEYIDAKGQGRCDADEHNPFRVSVGISTADFYCSYGEREGE